MRRLGLILLLLLLRLGAVEGIAQTHVVDSGTTLRGVADSVVQVKLGASAVELAGPWRFHTGDDPGWAQPGFDDSGWAKMDLTPPEGSADPTLGTSGYLPGWTAQGYPDYSGYAWYRLQVEVQGAQRSLALKMPDSVDDAYQVYVNGQKIGEFGEFAAHHVTAYSALPRAFRLPKEIRDGRITIAIRMWMDSATPFNSPDAGGMHGPPVLGYSSVIATQVQLDWDEIAHEVGSGFLEVLILLMALLMALALFWMDRQEIAYLWLALVCEVTLIGNATVLLVNFTTWIGQTAGVVLTDVLVTPVRIGLWVLFWGYWFRLSRILRLHQAVWTLVLLLMAGTAMLRPPLYGQVVPVHAASYLVPLLLALKLGLAALLFAVVYYGFKKQKAEGGMALTAVLLAAIANYQHELRLIHIRTAFSALGFSISLGTVSTILSLLIITVMLLRRFIHAQRKKEQWKLEIEQARHVQQVLLPDRLPEVAGLRIESEYRPAREVGGDFFQILPDAHDGSVLIVAGDVTGKGLQAGMLVALIVGAVRALVRQDSDPVAVLEAVNGQLCDREHASATCLAMRIEADGAVKMANAGHVAPYLNGREMEMEGALPLGILSPTEFPVISFELGKGDTLMLMSDGIAEATNARGELFGFERIGEMLRQPITAAELASAAQRFGQEDDILVLRVEREAGGRRNLRAEPELAAI